jgi:hypothetical protein
MKTHVSSGYMRQHKNYYKKPIHKRRGVIVLSIIILILALFTFWSINKTEDETSEEQKYTDQEFSPSLSARLKNFEGKVELKTDDAPYQEIAENYQISTNNTVRTDSNSKATIELPDQSIIRLAQNSEVKFKLLGMTDIVIEIISGHSFHRVSDKSKAIYKVVNGKTELTSLGTAFDVLVSSHLTILTVTESRVKAKIFDDSEDIINMRTIDSGSKATINPLQATDDMIEVETVSSTDLINNEWFAWNLEQDRALDFFLGIFEETVKLVVLEPATSEISVDSEKIKVVGATDPNAEIFIAGLEIDNNNGNFQTELLLGEGENEFEITVKVGKNINKKTIYVNSTKAKEGITLTGAKNDDNEISLSWELKDDTDYKEFKIVNSTDATPTYPEDTFHTAKKSTFTDSWENLAGKQYFSVCALDGADECVTYSNTFSIELTEADDNEEPQGNIELSLSKDTATALLSWTYSADTDSADEFKTIIAQSVNPLYPGNSYHSISKNSRSDSWQKLAAGTYHFRVCLIRDTKCQLYSNNESITIDEVDTGSITLSATADERNVILSWSVNNLPITKGYKALFSESPSVTFDSKTSHHFITDADDTSDTWSGLEAGKTYYFRVCENISSSQCGVYSNETSITIEE